MSPWAKAVAAAVGAFSVTWQLAMPHVTGEEWSAIVVGSMVTGLLTWLVPNTPSQPPR